MAVVSDVVKAATDVNAQSLVFSDKAAQADQLLGNDNDSPSESSSEKGNITPKEFYWDQIMFYLVSAILGLSFLDISVEFFRGSTVQCFTPNDFTRDQISYLNNYCYSHLPHSQYYLIFILISALLIIAPHYLWSSYFGRHFDFFFDLVKKLDRLRDSNTGDYNPHNYDLVRKLENKFSKFNTWIYRLYMLKLMIQLLISITVLLVNLFFFQNEDFKETYTCPESLHLINTTEWPVETQVTCVYNSLNLLKFLRWAACILLCLSIMFLLVGLVWGIIRHPNELGIKDIALFSVLSCLPPEEHNFPSTRTILKNIFTCGKVHRKLATREIKETRISLDEQDFDTSIDSETEDIDDSRKKKCGHNIILDSFQQLLYPGISSDLDFLLMKLYFADSGHGQVFKDIQIYKEIQQLLSRDQELLYLLKRIQADRYLEQIDKLQHPGNYDNEDLKNRIYKAGLESAGPGRNPELEVYKKYQHLMGIDIGDWSSSIMRSVIYGFLDKAPRNSLAVDISFGASLGYSLVLARVFDHVATFHFNKYYKNAKEIFRCKEYQAGYTTIVYQEDVFSQEAAKIVKCEKPIINMFKHGPGDRSIDLIVIGPINDRSKIATANLLIEKLYAKEKYFTKRSILIAIRPLKIGSKGMTDHFVQYTPPSSIYRDINDDVETKLIAHNIKLYSVTQLGNVVPYNRPPDNTTSSNRRRRGRPSKTRMRLRSIVSSPKMDELPRGIPVECGDLECIFEFKIYEYTGRYVNEQNDDHTTLPSQNNDQSNNERNDDHTTLLPQDNDQSMIMDNESQCTGSDEVILSPTTGLPTNIGGLESELLSTTV